MTEAEATRLEAWLASPDKAEKTIALEALHDSRAALHKDLGWRTVSVDAIAAVRREYSQHMQLLKAAQKQDRTAARALKEQVKLVTLAQRGAQWLHDYLTGGNAVSPSTLDPWQLYGVRTAWGLAECLDIGSAQ